MRVAIVHDWLNQKGGAEEVLEVLHAMFPNAPVFTSIYERRAMPLEYRSWPIRTSFMQRFPGVDRYHRALLPLYPWAFRSLDFSGYDLVMSNSSGFCHGVAIEGHASHINYCLTPPRYVWGLDQYAAVEGLGLPARSLLALLAPFLRRWDYRAAQGVDHFIGISQVVQERVRRFYGREAAVIYPPVNTGDFAPATEKGDYFLIVSRLVPYKRIDLAVAAFQELGWPLLVVGEGRGRAVLERRAPPNVRFLGRLPRDQVRELLAGCRALIFPGEEDFGIAPVEAQAAGRPVIAYAGGGARETVLEGVSGLFFWEASPQSLTQALLEFSQKEKDFDPAAIRRQALRFDTQVFRERMTAFIAEKLGTPVALGGG